MTFLAFTGLINGVCSASLGVYVLLKNIKRTVNRIYFIFDISIAIFSFGYFFWQLSSNTEDALFWFHILAVGIIYINITFLHLVFYLLDLVAQKRKLLVVCYLINTFFAFFNFSGLLYPTVVPRYDFGFWPVPTKLFMVYLPF